MTLLDCVFILLFSIIFAILLVIETQISSIKAMMEEHTRYEEPLKNGHKKK